MRSLVAVLALLVALASTAGMLWAMVDRARLLDEVARLRIEAEDLPQPVHPARIAHLAEN